MQNKTSHYFEAISKYYPEGHKIAYAYENFVKDFQNYRISLSSPLND